MIKSWLITTEAPFCGAEQYYGAYAEDGDKLIDWLYVNWFDQECQNLYDLYGYKWEEGYDEEYEEVKDDFDDYDHFLGCKYEEWCQNCSMKVEECEDPGGEEELKIIYDERKK